MRVLIWFHRDLRTHDHAALSWALAQGHEVMGIVFAPTPEASSAKRQFWDESAENLKLSLASAKIPLILSQSTPELEIPRLLETHEIELITTHQRMNSRDREQLERVRKAISIELKELGDVTLFDPSEATSLTLGQMRPFTGFKNMAQAQWRIPEPLPSPSQLSLPKEHSSDWATGGETSALARLSDYVWQSKACLHYHESRNGMIVRDDSSKFSRWLSIGALSPRLIYQELKKLEAEQTSSPGIEALIYELIWRDYFKFLASLMQDMYFSLQGLKKVAPEWIEDFQLAEAWRRGETGQDFLDANLRELRETGWMSNRGRQNVASYFAKNARLNWTLGAQWFEAQLIDEDPELNWGNWQYFSGVGTDPRDRRFDFSRQAEAYDPANEYQNLWLSESKEIEAKILERLTLRDPGLTICPSEVLLGEDKKDPVKMEKVRSAARRLANRGIIEICQKGLKVEPYGFKGPIRLRLVSAN